MTFDLDQRCVLNTPDRPSAAPNRVRVLVADDHPAVRCALESLVRACSELELVGSACTGEEAVALAARLCPHVVVMDLSMPGLGGVEATRQVRAQRPAPVVIAFSGSRELVGGAVAAGASAPMLKDEDPQRLLDAIRAASGA